MLTAIAAVETGNNASKLGRYGERSQLQILPATWREFSRLPHSAAASNPAETNRVARAYLSVIRNHLKSRGLPETPFLLAAGWNAGPDWKKLRPGTVSYAERVSNLVEASRPRIAPAPHVVVPTAIAVHAPATKPVPMILVADLAPRGS